MAYPSSDYPRTELLIDGVWTDVSDIGDTSVRGEGGTSGISITRGRAEAQQRVSAQTSTFRITNPDGVLSNRNPASSFYGKLPRNTQVRHLAGDPSGSDTLLRMTYQDIIDFNGIRTPDAAALDVTGDLEVRADIWPHTWRPDGDTSGHRAMLIASKYQVTSNQRSWALYLWHGLLAFTWSTDGTSAARVTTFSTVEVPADSGRLSVKVTLDVNNGAAGNDVKFYTAPSIDGTYTQLGATVTNSGVSSVFSSSADLCMGIGDDNAGIFGGFTFGGRFYEFRLYSGIAGSQVANPNFTTQDLGDNSFADAAGRTWTIEGTARICSDRIRFHGELASLAHTWDLTGRDITAAAQGAGLLRRLTSAGRPLRSPMFRQFNSYDSVVGWWPLEDASGAATLASGLPDGRPARLGGVQSGNDGNLPGASSTVAFTGASNFINAFPDTTVSSTGTLMLIFFIKISAFPATHKTVALLYTTGTARRIEVGLDSANWRVDFYASDGTNLSSSTTAAATVSPVGQWVGVNVLLETNGGNVDRSVRWLVVGRDQAFSGIGPASYAGVVGKATQLHMRSRASGEFDDAQLSHLLIANEDIGFVDQTIADASNAYIGEVAAQRIDRLCSEEGVTVEITGCWDSSAAMGEQTVATLADLLYQCAEADLGMLGESRNSLALTYRTRGDLDARRDIEIDYTDSVLSAVPTVPEDDLGIVNDVTASQPGGTSSRFEVTTGPMSTQDPPDGIGPYERSFTVNVDDDTDLLHAAGWLAHSGSAEDARIPNVQLALHRSQIAGDTTLAEQVRALECGDTLALTGLPVPLPPDDALLLVQGYTELLSRFLWDLTLNTTPGSVHRTGIYEVDTVNGDARWDTGGSDLNTSVNTSATTIILDTTGSVTWTTDSAQYPFDIMMGGERITLTGVPGGSTSPQTFTSCTRSVNGVVKSHTAGALVCLAEPIYYAVGQ